jgi:hypothetical protein
VRRLFLFLVENPILLVILVAWVAGMINNARLALKKARERASLPPATGQQTASNAPSLPPRTAEQIQREMRRILGVEPAEGDERRSAPPAPPALPRAQPKPLARTAAERHRAWDRPTVEKPPAPVVPSMSSQRRSTRVDPHVGEAMARRANLSPPRAAAVGHSQLGDLGGRVHHDATKRAGVGRYALTDLKRIMVLNEILGPPLALRRSERDI